MPDISMCGNPTCPLAPKCYRAQATPHPYWQAYSSFTPREKVDGWDCDHFMKMREEG